MLAFQLQKQIIAKEKLSVLSVFYIGSTKVSKASIVKIDNMMANNQKLDAIKYVREISGLGLADAKAWVENYKSVDLHHPQTIGTSSPTTFANNSSSNNTIKPSGGCYIATCVYGSYDCPPVWTLRRYRDDVLGSTWYGRLFIQVYYAVSPTLVKWFGKTAWFKKMWKGTLDRMVKKLEASGIGNTPYEDKHW